VPDDPRELALAFYDEVVGSRDRIADLAPATPHDVERAGMAMHEVVFHLITPPSSRKADPALPAAVRDALTSAARDRAIDPYALTIAMLAAKLADRSGADVFARNQLEQIATALDALTFDYRRPKPATLGVLKELRADIEARIAYVRSFRPGAYRFLDLPELYQSRRDKSEGPDRFFARVYRAHVARGLTQGDIRRVDPAFYNVLHVWCTRHQKKLTSLVPTTRRRRS
jgi:hypothetical protein